MGQQSRASLCTVQEIRSLPYIAYWNPNPGRQSWTELRAPLTGSRRLDTVVVLLSLHFLLEGEELLCGLACVSWRLACGCGARRWWAAIATLQCVPERCRTFRDFN